MTIRVARVYKAEEAGQGRRFLVDRLWPRGIKKSDLQLDGWLKDVAPSEQLRKWFGHDAARWREFVRRYRAELDEHPESWKPLQAAARRGRVLLLFGAKDEAHNNAVALRDYLEDEKNVGPERSGTDRRHARPR